MTRKTVIAIVGSTDEGAERNARALGTLVAARGWVVLTGGRDHGVMRAAAMGAKAPTLTVPGLTVGLLPDTGAIVGPEIDVAIVTGMGEARNNAIVLSGDVVVACGVDGPGTASEVSLALRNRRNVVLLGATPEATAFFEQVARRSGAGPLLAHADSPDEAIARIDDVLRDQTP